MAHPDRKPLSAAQSRMARAGLRLSLDEAARRSLVSRATIVRFENGSEILPAMRLALRVAFEREGVRFTGAGVEIQAMGSAS